MIITNRGFKKPDNTDPYNIQDQNDNIDIIESELNEIDETLNQVFQSVSNGKAIVAGAITDKGVNTSPTATFETMANNIDAIETDPSIGTTNATAADVLTPKKVVSQGQLIIGTMPNRGPSINETINLTEQNQEYTIATGFHSGLRKIKTVITGLAASVIKYGAMVGGVEGNFTGDANATAAQMLKDVVAYVKGNKIVGTILSKGAQTYTPGTTNQVIAVNQFLSGDQTIVGSPNFIESNIKNGVNMWGKVGTLKPMRSFSVSDLNMKSGGSYIDELDSIDGVIRPIETNAMLFHVTADSDGDVSITGSGAIFICPTRGSWSSVLLPYSNRVGNGNGIHVFNPNGILVGIQYNAIVSRFIL